MIFSDLNVAMNVGASPSGFVSGGSTCARVWRSKFDDGDAGLDRVSTIFFRVFTAKFRDFLVFFLFLEVPSVNVHPRFQALRGLTCSKKKNYYYHDHYHYCI
jgi:hypothetical protein